MVLNVLMVMVIACARKEENMKKEPVASATEVSSKRSRISLNATRHFGKSDCFSATFSRTTHTRGVLVMLSAYHQLKQFQSQRVFTDLQLFKI